MIVKFISRFKFLVSFMLAIIVALAPSFYEEYKHNQNKTNIYFTYESFEDIGLKILQARYAHVGSLATLIQRYRESVKNAFKVKKFTVQKVIKTSKVQIPMNVAINLIAQLHQPTIDIIKRPYISRFTLYNKSNNAITIHKLVISTDDAYSNPVWDLYFDFPCEKNCIFKHTLSNCIGYVLEFNKKMLLPAKTKLQLFIFFPDLPIIKLDNSFAEVHSNGNNDFIVALQNEEKNNVLNLYLMFTLRIIVAFLIVLGLAYLFLLIKKGVHNNMN